MFDNGPRTAVTTVADAAGAEDIVSSETGIVTVR